MSLPVAATGPATYVVDFTDEGVPHGWTVENGDYRSPEYPNAVDRIELRYSCAGASASATINAFPKQGGGTTVATLTAASSGAAFDFPETTDFRSFRIVAANGFALSSFVSYLSADSLDAPSGVSISNNITGTSFDASWHPVAGATGYRVYVWTSAVADASESGYSLGLPSYIVNGLDVGAATEHSFTGLPSVPVLFAVEAYGRRGVTSKTAEPVEVDLSNPDKVAQLNACPLSSLAANTYMQNFDSTAEITATTGNKNWLNGTTIMYWQAYKDADAVGSFCYNGGAGTTGGLYALATNRDDNARALGALSTQNDEFSFGITFTNDMDRIVKLSSLAYFAQQWGFANKTNQTLSVSVMVTNELNWISSYVDGWRELSSTQSAVYGTESIHDTPVSTPVEVTPAEEVSIAPGQVLIIKWTIHSLKSGKSAMMGIDDVTVTFSKDPSGFVIKLAASTHTPKP